MTTRSWLLVFLALDIIGMALVAALYLRKRKLSLFEYLIWAVIALIPVLGPFLLIISSPGRSNQSHPDQIE